MEGRGESDRDLWEEIETVFVTENEAPHNAFCNFYHPEKV